MLSNPGDDWMATNVHEGSHVGVWQGCGLEPTRVKVWHASRSGKACVHVPKEIDDDWFERYLLGVIGGSEGEAHYWRLYHGYSLEAGRRKTRAGASYDIKKFHEYTQYLDEPLTEEEARKHASGIILANWQMIVVTASRLARVHTMHVSAIKRADHDRGEADLWDLFQE